MILSPFFLSRLPTVAAKSGAALESAKFNSVTGRQTTAIFFCFSCHRREHSRAEIEAAMIHYDSLLQKMNADSIALMAL